LSRKVKSGAKLPPLSRDFLRSIKMANFKALEKKDKRYIFTAYENDTDPNPASVIFKKFPRTGKIYFENLKYKKKSDPSKDDAENTENIDTDIELDGLPEFNTEQFVKDCIEGFENLTFEGKEIKTPQEFLELPDGFIYYILLDCHTYAVKTESFTKGESNPL
jgi:hypothetical protein